MSPLPRPTPVAHTLGELADTFSLAVAPAVAGLPVTGVTHDSRAVQPGDLFAALPGAHAHGIAFVGQARSLGAVAVLTDPAGAESTDLPTLLCDDPRAALGAVAAEIYGNPARNMLVIGITGTNGKTTTAYLLEAGLRAAGFTTGLLGTTGIHIGHEQLPSARTTPEAPDLHALLAVMRERGVTAVVMEVSSHALALGRVDGLLFDAAIFTNLSQDHLDFHPTMQDYFEAKATLFTREHAQRAVINVDDEWGRTLVPRVNVPVTTFGFDYEANVMCRGITEDMGVQHLEVIASDGHHDIPIGIPGRFNAVNGLAAWTTLHLLGLPDDAICAGMADVRVPGRMQLVNEGQSFVALVDYAHSPDSVERVISSVTPVDGGKKIVVLGCGGDRDRDKRPIMGRLAAELADVLIVTDDNPRSEDPATIRAAMLSGATSGRAVVSEIGDRREAIQAAVAAAQAGDVVLILGKGHEPGQEIAGVTHPFSDSAELALALKAAS